MVRIGIMTHRVVPGPRLNSMRARARMAGFDDVVVFSPAHVNLKRRKLCGYVYRSPGWKRTTCAIPPVIHDIGYYTSRDLLKKAIRIKRRSRLLFTGYGLGNKERIERMIKSHPVLNGFVLPSLRPSTVEQALEFVRQHRDVAVKPLNGSRGRGIRKVSLTDPGVPDRR